MYCDVAEVLKYLPKSVKDVLTAENDYESLVEEKIKIAQDYITFVLLFKDYYLSEEDVTPVIKMFTAQLAALYVIEYYIHIAPESINIDFSEPNYKMVIVNKINELKEFIKNNYNTTYVDNLDDSFYKLFVPKDIEENG